MYVCPQSVTVYLCACLSIQCLHTQRERPKIRRKRIKTFLMFSNDALAFDVYASLMPYFAKEEQNKLLPSLGHRHIPTHTHSPVSMWWRCGKTFVVVTLFACSISCVCVFIYEWNFSIFVCVGGRRDTLKSESEFGNQIDFMFTYLENTHGSLLLMRTLALWFLLYLPALTGDFTCTRSYLRSTNTMHYI